MIVFLHLIVVPPAQFMKFSISLIPQNRLFSTCLAIFTVFGVLLSSVDAQRAGDEITYPNDAFAKLDTFEGLNLPPFQFMVHS